MFATNAIKTMQAQALINNSYPPLKISDSGKKALQWMDAFHVNYLPVLDKTFYSGIISKAEIISQKEPDQSIGTYDLKLSHPCILESQHVYEIFNYITNYKIPVLPVVDENNNYRGLIVATDLIQFFAEIKSLKAAGSVLVVSTRFKENPLSHVIELIEANDAHVLSADVNELKDSDTYEVTLKINRTDLSRIQSALFRSNIDVKEIYHHSDFAEDLQQRFDSLMNYLNI